MKNPNRPGRIAPASTDNHGTRPARPIRLLLLPDASGPDGAPRSALLLPDALTGRARLRAFPTLAAALVATRDMETAQ